jgi:hypothetical protein
MISNITKRSCLPVIGVIAMILIFLNAPTECYGQCECEDYVCINIDIVPNVLNLEREGECVTVHTNIAYSEVYLQREDDGKYPVALSLGGNEVKAYYCKSDLRGNLVAKFAMGEIETTFKNVFDTCEKNTFKLTGQTKDGECFCGTQDILVVDADCNRPL